MTLVRNTGTPERAAFAPPEQMTDRHGNILQLNRERLIPDNNSEGPCGQLKPFVCDWDGDGKLDILVGSNANHIIWLQAYDPRKNCYQQMVKLKVEGLLNPFGFRKGPAAADFDGDGRLELVAVDSLGRICRFAQGKGPDGAAHLQPPIPLKFTNGKPILNSDIGRALARTEGVAYPVTRLWFEPSITLAVSDWTGNGTLDMFISSNWYTFFLENVGSNAEPRFKQPVVVSNPQGEPLKISQHESHVTVFDGDGDGRADLIIGGESGGLYLLHHDWVAGITPKVKIEDLAPAAR